MKHSTSFRLALVLMTCCFSAPVTAASAEEGQAVTDADMADELLSLHNQARIATGRAPVKWDNALAADAAHWAATLARDSKFEHSPPMLRRGQGENMWMGSLGYFTPDHMVGSWTDEARITKSGAFPNVSTTGNWVDVGHYTQMIWPETTHVGCAIRDNGAFDYLVCRYAPAGNILGYDFQVTPQTKKVAGSK